jgi:anti-sigma factor RsiW
MNQSNHQTIQDMLSAYALDALDPEDWRSVKNHLRGCDQCQRDLKEYRSVVSQIPLSLSAAAPHPKIKHLFLERIQSAPQAVASQKLFETEAQTRRDAESQGPSLPLQVSQFSLRQWLGWAVALAASVALFFMVQENADLQRQVTEQAAELARIQGQVADMRQVLVTLRDPEVHLALLAGHDRAPNAKARMFWNPQQRAGYFAAYDLPPLPPEKTYQLWVIAQGPPIGAGTFSVDQHGYGEVRVASIPRADLVKMFAVTIEPAGGREQPTLDQMVLSGTYQ